MGRISTAVRVSGRERRAARRAARPAAARRRRARTCCSRTASRARRTPRPPRSSPKRSPTPGLATLRFDFTGLGGSEGEFANTDFSSNVADLVAAARWLETEHRAPSLLVGHSLGGAAVLAAAAQIPSATAVATINAPSDPAHLGEAVRRARGRDPHQGRGGSRSRRPPLHDPPRVPGRHRRAEGRAGGGGTEARAAGHARAGGRDRVGRPRVGDLSRGEASEELRVARHRRPPADPARGRALRGDRARRVGEPLPAGGAADGAPSPTARATRCWSPRRGRASSSSSVADRPASPDRRRAGRRGRHGQRPHALRSPARGTRRVHGDDGAPVRGREGHPARRAWRSRSCTTKTYATDCAECETKEGKIDRIERVITLEGDLDDAMRAKLLEIANKCPVHRTLHSEMWIPTRLA